MLVVLGWVAGAGMLLYSFMFAISLVTLIFELDADWVTLLTRGSGVVGGVLTLAGAIAEQRRARHACPHCGRAPGHTPARRGDPAPRWAYIAGYATVVGCAVRVGGLVIDYLVTGRPLPVALGWSFSVFVVLLILAGTLLPLALVHRWGRIWPRWVMPFAGRNVPRWLVLGPALFVGAGLTGYFGVAGMTEMVLLGQGNRVGAPLWRILMEMLGYTVWGLGLLLAAISYHALTRSECRSIPPGDGSTLPVTRRHTD
ncbi:hypothetical protein DKM19_30485 [Streptosporangium sp. 'caverna']|nr:hypothetical protein DKM19_30485 [Streptosporangium sp. 'caverna']